MFKIQNSRLRGLARPSGLGNTKAKGFTLLELLIVLTIIGIASAIAGITLYGGLSDLKVKSAAKEIASTLRYARSQAISEKRIYVFALDPEKKHYYISPWAPAESENQSISAHLVSKDIPKDVIFSGSSMVYIFFYPIGSSTGGKFNIVSEKGTAWTILTEPSTGRVSIEKGKS